MRFAEVSRQFSPALTCRGDSVYRMRPGRDRRQIDAEVISVSGQRIEVRVSGVLNGQRSFETPSRMKRIRSERADCLQGCGPT